MTNKQKQEKMKLHKALKLRKKITGEIAKIKEQICSKNSYVVGNPLRYNIPSLTTTLDEKTNELIKLKCAINKTNNPIQSDIYRLAELKGLVVMWNGASVNEGEQTFGYGEKTVLNFKVQVNEEERDGLLLKIQQEIDDIQEKLDTFNYTTDLIE